MPLAESIGAGAAVAQAISAILPQLNGVRSAVIVVDNKTGVTLKRIGDHHDHGGFAVTEAAP